MNQPTIGGLIISAGLSERMRQLKPLISFDDKPFLAHIILKLNTVCQKIVIVTGHQSDTIKNEINTWLKTHNKNLNNIIWCYNPDFTKGMFTSLQRGLKELDGIGWILYHFVDQPNIPKQFYKQFVNQIDDEYEWIQPGYNSISGHPVLLSDKLVKPILRLSPTKSLRDLSKHKVVKRKIWSCNFPEILQDYDTPQQLKNLTKD